MESVFHSGRQTSTIASIQRSEKQSLCPREGRQTKFGLSQMEQSQLLPLLKKQTPLCFLRRSTTHTCFCPEVEIQKLALFGKSNNEMCFLVQVGSS